MNLTTRQLRIFVLLAETLSFHKTADILHITQLTLSKLVKEIEATLGIELFERSTRMVRLSRAGQDILDIARKITARYEQGMLELGRRLRERHVDIAVTAMGNEGPPDLRYQELFTEPFVLFHSRRTKPAITRWNPTELSRLPLIPESSFDQAVHQGICRTRMRGAPTRSVGMFIRREYRPASARPVRERHQLMTAPSINK